MSYISNFSSLNSLRAEKIKFGIGGFFLVFFGFGIIMGIAGDEELRKNLFGMIVLFLFSLIPVFLGIRQKQFRIRLTTINHCLLTDADGSIEIDKIAYALHMSPKKAAGLLENLLNKGYFHDVTFDPISGIVTLPQNADNFVHYTCPHCGASIVARAGTIPRCEFCGGVFTPPKKSN